MKCTGNSTATSTWLPGSWWQGQEKGGDGQKEDRKIVAAFVGNRHEACHKEEKPPCSLQVGHQSAWGNSSSHWAALLNQCRERWKKGNFCQLPSPTACFVRQVPSQTHKGHSRCSALDSWLTLPASPTSLACGKSCPLLQGRPEPYQFLSSPFTNCPLMNTLSFSNSWRSRKPASQTRREKAIGAWTDEHLPRSNKRTPLMEILQPPRWQFLPS